MKALFPLYIIPVIYNYGVCVQEFSLSSLDHVLKNICFHIFLMGKIIL